MAHTLLKTRNLRIVSLVNQKGGVGKTVSCISLASGLAVAGQKTLVIDGDPQGNLSLFFAGEGSPEQQDLSHLLREMIEGNVNIDYTDFTISNVRENLDLLPLFNRRLRRDIPETDINDIRRDFANFLMKLKNVYDWILIDCSPSDGKLENLLISASEVAMVPLEFQLFSIAGLKSLLDEIQECASSLEKSILVEGLIFVRSDNRTNRIKDYKAIFHDFHIPIYEIGKSEVVPRSIELGKTVWEHAPTHFVSKDYYKIIRRSFIG